MEDAADRQAIIEALMARYPGIIDYYLADLIVPLS